jgi:hypothetical protein
MVEPVNNENEEELSLLSPNNKGDGSWQLNFDGYQLSPERKEKRPPRGIHDCYGVLGILKKILIFSVVISVIKVTINCHACFA